MKPSEKRIERVDQFFKNKLADYTLAPSENAWTKVEAGLSKKNNVGMWRLAAAILLMGALITFIYWPQRSTETSRPTLAHKKIKKSETKSIAHQQKIETPGIIDVTQKLNVNSERSNLQKGDFSVVPPSELEEVLVLSKTSEIKKIETNKSLIKSAVQSSIFHLETIQKKGTVTALTQVEKITGDVNPVISSEEKIKPEATPEPTVASSKQKPIKLEFTLEDLPSVETVATTNEVKNTGLKKVLTLAREMKEGEGPLFNLKEKKNEAFARNFITLNERTQ